jgi:mRNA interferase RelE/StbE
MASYKVEWKNSAYKELQKLPRPMIERVVEAVDDLAINPYPSGIKKLVGSDHSYRIRVGDYRIIYDVVDNKLLIHIVRVRHRKDAYK